MFSTETWEAVIVDPQRDAWRFLAAAEAKKWRIRYMLETHVHNDYLSGALAIRHATGAEIGAPAQGGYAFPYLKLADGDEIRVGALRIGAWETPGHTWEHTSYLVHADGAPDPVGAAAEQVVTQLLRIGFDHLEGYLSGGVAAWQAEGRPIRSYPLATVDDLCHAYLAGEAPQILDVRQPSEFSEGHVPGSLNLFVGDLPQRLQEVPTDKELWVACAGGRRASLAASLLDRAGMPVRLIAQGGIPEWLAHCFPRQRGSR